MMVDLQSLLTRLSSGRGRVIRVVSRYLILALLAGAMASCTSISGLVRPPASENLGGDPPETNPTSDPTNENQKVEPTPVDEADAALVYAQCVRDNGYPEFPDPIPGRGIMLRRDQGMSFNDPRMLAAMEACQDLRPPSTGNFAAGSGGAMGQGLMDEEAQLAFAQCMRENGVPGFPDPPSLSGGRMVIGSESGINPLDPRFQLALYTCLAAVSGENQ
jgi:hypothetical protein